MRPFKHFLRTPRATRFLALAVAGLLPATTLAGPDWALCGTGFQAPPAPTVENGGDAGAVHLSADDADLQEQGVSTLQGNVHIRSGTQQLQSDVARYDKDNERLEAEGNVRYWDKGLFITGSRGQLGLDSDEASAEDTSFMLLDSHGHGTAKRVEISGSDLIRASGATYSTCNPGDEAWLLSAESIKLDKLTDVGTARNVTVKFKNVPIFYSPYLTFPLSDKRKTGFLTPSFRTGGEVGLEVRAPYYWNIAPNQDATLTARGMTNRGAMVEGEYRYLTGRGGGEIGVEYLPHDTKRGDDRGAFSFRHNGSFAPGWNTDIAVDYVSDKEYFEELGTQLAISSTRFLDRHAVLTYSGNRWWAQGLLQNYQTVDNTIVAADKPYERLPQVRFGTSLPQRNRRLHFGLSGEVVQFERDSSVTGTRVDLEPTVSFPVRTPGTFIIPRASLRHTQYRLDNTAAGISDGPSRTLPIISVDSGMFFDREMHIGGNAYTHTLEPRAYYLLVPYDDQRSLPVFDTGEYSFNFAQLFRDDRFSGADRVGDAHQVTLALTSRILEPASGEEVFRASIGQIRYFRDRKVTLPGTPRDIDRTSDMVAEVAARIAGSWRISAGLQWDTGDGRTDKNTVSLRYQPDSRRVLNISYRFVRGVAEQVDSSVRWPLTHNLGLVGRFNYAVDDEQILETFGGVEYESCCWALRAVARRYLSNSSGEHSNAVFLQFELKGLAGVGRKTGQFLERSIPGYQNEF